MKNDVVEMIKSRLDIVDVVGEYISLIPAGSNYKAKSPFRTEKTPSFIVSPELQIFKDFGGDKAGDMFAFVMEMEGVTFREALEMLAEKAGVKLTENLTQRSSLVANDHISTPKPLLFKVLAHSVKVYSSILKSEKGKEAREYLSSRHISQEMIAKFDIGYAPDSFRIITEYFRKKHISDEILLATGLGVKHQVQQSLYDRFRGRLMFPIRDVMGRTVGYSARILPSLDDGKTGKYINSPQGQIYDKGAILFGLNLAKSAIKKAGCVIIVEGNLDVIMSHQAEVEHVVAVSGTSLTDAQLKLLKRFTDKLILSFDADEAGFLASVRHAQRAFSYGFEVEMIEISGGKDVADLVEIDAQLWRDMSSRPIGFLPFYIQHLRAQMPHFGPKQKQSIIAQVAPLLAEVRQPIEKDSYIHQLSHLLGLSPEIVYKSLPQSQKLQITSPQVKTESSQKSPELDLQEKIFGFACFILEKDAIIRLENYIFTHPPVVQLLLALKTLLQEEKNFDREFFTTQYIHEPSLMKYFHELYLMASRQIEELSMDQLTITQTFNQLLVELKKIQIQKTLQNIRLQIQEAKLKEDTHRTQELLQKYNQLMKVRQAIH